MKEYKLDAFEQSIEDEAEQYKPVVPSIAKMISDKIDAINAQRTITVRLSESDALRLRQKSQEAGLSEQMFIADLLHRFAVSEIPV
jgi:predicted DNA binding CopG/RHH family protein